MNISDPAAGRVYFSTLQQPEYGTAELTVTLGEEQREEFHRNMNRDEEAAAGGDAPHGGFSADGFNLVLIMDHIPALFMNSVPCELAHVSIG